MKKIIKNNKDYILEIYIKIYFSDVMISTGKGRFIGKINFN